MVNILRTTFPKAFFWKPILYFLFKIFDIGQLDFSFNLAESDLTVSKYHSDQ